MRVTGKILEINDTQQISDAFKKRTFVLEYIDNPQYPEYISFECTQDRCSLLDGFQPGQEVDVNFNLKGRKWVNPAGETRYFNALQAWRIDAVSDQSQPAAQAQSEPAPVPTNEEADLPF